MITMIQKREFEEKENQIKTLSYYRIENYSSKDIASQEIKMILDFALNYDATDCPNCLINDKEVTLNIEKLEYVVDFQKRIIIIRNK